MQIIEANLRSAAFVQGLDEFRDEDWADYRTSVVARTAGGIARPGRYASAARKRAHGADPSDEE